MEILKTSQEVESYYSLLKKEEISTIAIDIEAEFNLHSYGEKLCLIQIYDGKREIVIDPIDLEPKNYRRFFDDKNILKIMFDAQGDKALLLRGYGIPVHSVFDLKPAVDLLPFEKRDLGSILNVVLDVPLKNKKRFQQYNWQIRPIELLALEYAMDDVLFLFKVKEVLLRRLVEENLFDQFLLANYKIENKVFDPPIPGILKKREFSSLGARQKDLFKKILAVREEAAKELDLPPNSVLPNRFLFDLMKNQKSLHFPYGNKVSQEIKNRLDKEIGKILQEGK